MTFSQLQQEMWQQLTTKDLFEQAQGHAYAYIQQLSRMDAFPSEQALANLAAFEEDLPAQPGNPAQILDMLHQKGSPATTAQNGGRYFGFVCGSALPVALAAKWLGDIWDQNAATFLSSPLGAKLEAICEAWLIQLFGLPPDTVAALVGGSSIATVYGLMAARNELLARQGWDVREQGLVGGPPLRVVLSSEVHSAVWKALALLGLGRQQIEQVPVDNQGRLIAAQLPPLDSSTLVICQAGHVASGAFDPIEEICQAARAAQAWVHVDGAFGLWAAASPHKSWLTKGLEQADSWSVDAHKTLNAPYDCGILLCRHREALSRAVQMAANYIPADDQRNPMDFTPEMSRRARGIELWATLKYLGRSGIAALVDHLCELAHYFAENLQAQGFTLHNDVVFNQVLVSYGSSQQTAGILHKVQRTGICWCGHTLWQNRLAIRISICSWQTTQADIDACLQAFTAARDA